MASGRSGADKHDIGKGIAFGKGEGVKVTGLVLFEPFLEDGGFFRSGDGGVVLFFGHGVPQLDSFVDLSLYTESLISANTQIAFPWGSLAFFLFLFMMAQGELP